MAGAAPSRQPAVCCYGGGGLVPYGYDDEYDDHGRDAAPPPARHGRGKPYEYVYDEEDNDDYKVFPPPAPDTVIESTGHGYTIVPMKRDDEGLFARAAGAEEQRKTTPLAAAPENKDGRDGLVAADKDGGVAGASPLGGCVGGEADDNPEDLEDMLYYEFYYYADDGLAEEGTTTARNMTLRSAWVSTGIVET